MTAVKNIFPQHLGLRFPPPPPDPTLARVKVYVGEPAHLMVPAIANLSQPIVLQITRPDGTSYIVDDDFIYISILHGKIYVDYTASMGEFTQIGWYLAQFSMGDAITQFEFYIYPPAGASATIGYFPLPPVPPITSNAYVAEDGVTFYVAKDGVTNYVQES